MELLRSEPFTVSRVQLARGAAEAYVRSFWWFIVPGPIFGILLIVFGTEQWLQALGALGVMWPVSIPARAYFITAGLARRLATPTTLEVLDDGLYFSNERAKFKAPFTALRSVSVRHDMFVFRSRRYDAILVPLAAFPSQDRQREFLSVVSEHGVRTNAKSFLEL